MVRDKTDHCSDTQRPYETEFKTVFECCPDAIFLADAESGTITEVNQAACELMGMRREALVGLHHSKLHPEEEVEKYMAIFREHVEKGAAITQDVHVQRPSGQLVPVDISARTMELCGETVVQAVFRDESERRRAEEALARERERFRVLVEESPLGVCCTGDDGRYEYINRKFTEMFGYAPEDVPCGREWFMKAYPDPTYRSEVLSTWKADVKAAAPGGFRPRTFTVMCKDGSQKVIHFRAAMMETGGQFVFYEDITERQRADDRIRESEGRYRSLFEESAISLWEEDWSAVRRYVDELRASDIMDLHGYFHSHPEAVDRCIELVRLVDVNRATLELHEAENKGEVLAGLGRVLTKESYQVFRDELVALSEGRRHFESEAVHQTLCGERKHVLLRLNLPDGYEDSWAKVIVSMLDITERKRAEEQLRRSNEELATLNAVARTVSGSLDLEEVMNRALDEVLDVMGMEVGTIRLLGPGKGVMTLMAHRGLGEAYIEAQSELRLSEQIMHSMITGGEAFVLEEPLNEPLAQPYLREAMGQDMPRSLAVVPLRSKEEVLGMLVAISRKPRRFSNQDVELLSSIGSQVGMAVENATLYQEQRRRLSEMEALRQTTLDISRQLDVPQLLRSIVERATALVGARGGGLYLHYPNEGELELVVSYSLGKDYTGTRLKVGEGLSGRVALTGEPLIVEDYASLNDRAEQYTDAPFRGVMAVPLRWGDRIVGVLNVTDVEQPRIFTDHDLWLLELFANQAAIAIQNARLHEEALWRLKELSAIEEISHKLSSTLDFQHVIQLVLDKAIEATGSSAGTIAVLDDCKMELSLLAAAGFPREAIAPYVDQPLSVERGIVGRVARKGELSLVNDVRQDPDYIEVVPETRSQLTVPIMREDTVAGAIVLESPQLRGFTQEQAAFVQHLATHAAVAMGNARLHEETVWRVEELSAIEEIVHELSSTLDFQKVIELVLYKAIEATDASAGAIAVLEEQRGELPVLASRGYPLEELPGYPDAWFSIDEGIVGRVVRTGEMAVVGDVTQDPDYCVVLPQTRSQLTVPIMREEEVAGVIVVESPTLGGFSKEQAGFVQHLAKHAAVAMENARLYGRLRESEERYRTYVENVPDAIWETDAQGRFTYWSPQSRNLIGYAPDQLLGHTPYEFLIHPEDRDQFRSHVSQLVKARREEHTLSHRTIHADGSILHIETSIRPVWGDPGKVVKFQGVARDISERLRLQAHLIQSAKLSGIGQMIAGVAHELNNPLTTVMGYAQLLQTSDVSESVREDLEKIYRDALRAQRIVQNLLTFARQKRPQRTPVEINETVERTLVLRRYQLEVDGIQLITELAEDLPWTMADSYQLQQVFLNIVNNAHQAMTEAGAGGVLTVRSELTAGNAIRVSFTDTGPGIPSDVLDQVFDPFFTTKEVGVGTGLGLSVSHGIVQEHGGRIWAESQLGRGATFFVELPVRSWIEDLALPSAEYGTERIPPAGKRIMVVDDDRSTVELVVRALTDSGYRVDGVTSARLALDRLRWVRYDLMICDIRMPEISGVEWESEVRAMDPELLGRMVFITGDLLSPSTQGFLDRWQGRHINKPFDVDELRALVRDALEGEAGG